VERAGDESSEASSGAASQVSAGSVTSGPSAPVDAPVDMAVEGATDIPALIERMGRAARRAAAVLAVADTAAKNRALLAAAEAIADTRATLLEANGADLAAARERDLAPALLDRLELDEARIEAMARGLRDIAAQHDPVGTLSADVRRPSGLSIARMRVPIGVIGVIYESRPNVTADAAGICLKSGNAVILRGGSEAVHSNRVIGAAVQAGLAAASLPGDCVQLVPTTDRAAVGALLGLREHLDVLIPRGGKSLVARVAADARVPVIKHLDGICHVYIDAGADAARAVAVAVDAKTFRYGICGAMETLLVHRDMAEAVLAPLGAALAAKGVEIRGCERTRARLLQANPASAADWNTEYLGPILAVRIVDGLDDAIAHIAAHGSGHTDAIVTESISRARTFVRRVDSSSVMVNAATCFADGAEYGLGAEIGISTDRLHVRGPVGVLGLTTEKYVVNGDYLTRGGG